MLDTGVYRCHWGQDAPYDAVQAYAQQAKSPHRIIAEAVRIHVMEARSEANSGSGARKHPGQPGKSCWSYPDLRRPWPCLDPIDSVDDAEREG